MAVRRAYAWSFSLIAAGVLFIVAGFLVSAYESDTGDPWLGLADQVCNFLSAVLIVIGSVMANIAFTLHLKTKMPSETRKPDPPNSP